MAQSTTTRKLTLPLLATSLIVLAACTSTQLLATDSHSDSTNLTEADRQQEYSKRLSSISEDSDSTYLPVTTTAPEYPTRAAVRGIEGWTLVSFTVMTDGGIEKSSLQVVDSQPAFIFDRASLEAASSFVFEPRIVAGRAVEVPGVQYLFRYALGKDGAKGVDGDAVPLSVSPDNRDLLPTSQIAPIYPRDAAEKKIEGYVLVEFTVTQHGSVEDIAIVENSPDSIFDASAIAAAERFSFEPRIIDGTSIAVSEVQYMFTYKLAEN